VYLFSIRLRRKVAIKVLPAPAPDGDRTRASSRGARRLGAQPSQHHYDSRNRGQTPKLHRHGLVEGEAPASEWIERATISLRLS
jgi:hypothetical protein